MPCCQRAGLAIQQAAYATEHFVECVCNKYEEGRKAVADWSYKHLPDTYAYLIDRISQAVPEIFAALGALFGGNVIIPAIIIATLRRAIPMKPLLVGIIHGKVEVNDLIKTGKESWANFEEMFNRCIVPAFFVAMLVDTIVSFTIGYVSLNYERMLHAMTISLPGACLAAAYMISQRKPAKKTPSPAPSPGPGVPGEPDERLQVAIMKAMPEFIRNVSQILKETSQPPVLAPAASDPMETN